MFELRLPPAVATWRPTLFPGSEAAAAQGCTCPEQQPWPGALAFDTDCPVHSYKRLIEWIGFLETLSGQRIELPVISEFLLATLDFRRSSDTFYAPVPAGTVIGVLSLRTIGGGVLSLAVEGDDAFFFDIDTDLNLITAQQLPDDRTYDTTVAVKSTEGVVAASIEIIIEVLPPVVVEPPPPSRHPDLSPRSILLSALSLETGDTLNVSWDVLNQGDAAADPTTTEVRITTSPTSSSGTTAASVATALIPAGGHQAQSASITVPGSPGTYYICVVADAAGVLIDESDTTNNARSSAAITVSDTPVVPEPSALNTISIHNQSGSPVTNYPLQFGRPFIQGEIPRYPQVLINGTPAATQADVKQRYPDGSAKWAVIAVMIPSIPASGTTILSFQDHSTGNNTPLSTEDMLDAAYDFEATMHLDFGGGHTGNASARSVLAADDYKLWTSGQIAQTIELADDTTSRSYDLGNGDGYRPFRPRFYATFWPETHQVTIRYVGENGLTTELEDLAYQLSLDLGDSSPSTVYSIDLTGSKKHWARSNWTKTFWLNGTPEQKIDIDHNIKYLASTRFLPNFDTSAPIDQTAVTKLWSMWSAKPNDLYDTQENGTGLWTGRMGTAGGRMDIAPYPPWSVLWSYTGDWRLRTMALGMADIASAWSVNLRESDPNPRKFSRDGSLGTALGRPISIAARPTIYTSNLNFSSTKTADKVRIVGPINTESSTGWIYDSSHEPSPYYLQYILTGDPYYLQMMYNWAAHDAAVSWDNRGSIGIITNQIRGAAWVGVHRAETAFAAPDDAPEKHYFGYLMNDALATWESGFKITGTPFDGAPSKKGNNYYSRNGGPVSGQPPTLHNWESNTASGTVSSPGGDITAQEGIIYVPGTVGSMTSPWMQWFALYAIGRMRELGFAAGPLLAHSGKYLADIVNVSGHPEIVRAYRMPVERRGGGFMTWPEVVAAYLPPYLAARADAMTKPIIGEDYAEYTRGGAAYMLDNDVPDAQATWDKLQAVFSKVTTWQGLQAVWNIVRRTDTNILPEQSTVIPPL